MILLAVVCLGCYQDSQDSQSTESAGTGTNSSLFRNLGKR